MDFASLQEKFVTDTGTGSGEVSNKELAIWFNEAQIDLSFELGKVVRHTFENVIAGEPIPLPVDVLRPIASSTEYKLDPIGYITFDHGGTQTLDYRCVPPLFTGENDQQTSELHEAVHFLFVLFANSRYWSKESEGDGEEMNLANFWLNEYLRQKKYLIDKLFVGSDGNNLDQWVVIK